MIAMQPVDDRRSTPRIPIGNLTAHIDLRDGSAPLMACVWDISLGGACLVISPEVDVPPEFDLIISGRVYPVERRWRREASIGVRLKLAEVAKAA